MLHNGRIATLLAYLLGVFIFSAVSMQATYAQNETSPTVSTYDIGLLVSSREGAVSSTIKAIKEFTRQRIEQINRKGGINGVPLRLITLDDNENTAKTVKNVETILKNKNLIALVGLWSSTRGKAVVDMIGKSGVPFLSEMSLTELFSKHENIYTIIRSGVDETRLFQKFVKENHKSIMFYGVKGDLFTNSFRNAISEMGDSVQLTSEHWVKNTKGVNKNSLDEAIEAIKASDPEIICLAVGSNGGAAFLKRLEQEGISTPVFVSSGSIFRIQRNMGDVVYKGPLYQITGRIPYIDNERLARLKRRPEFAGLSGDYADDDIGYGITYSDMLSLTAKAAQAAGPVKSVPDLRRKIIAELGTYQEGRKFFRGDWRDWTFTQERSSAENTLIFWRNASSLQPRLWHTQYVRTSAGLSPAPVLYVGMDMVRIHSIDSNAKTFDAEFHFSITGKDLVDISNIEFTNAVRGDSEDKQLLTIRPIYKGGALVGHDPSLKVYKINGRFYFAPKLKNYPFDQQELSISFQPKSVLSPFYIQPSPKALRDREFDVLGWKILEGENAEYVGFDQDIISTIQFFSQEKKILPFNKFNFTWVLNRQALDYYLRVVIPLCLILLVAYFSIFIPAARIDTVVGIQVTTLLSIIALYLAIPKLDTDESTLSDQIFVFSETVVVMLICLSIVRVHGVVKEAPLFDLITSYAQVILFPTLTFLMVRYVSIVGDDPTVSSKSSLEILKRLIWLS